MRRARLDFNTKAIAWFMADYADYGTGERAYAGVTRLMIDSGASRSTVLRALKKLRELGLIRLVKAGNRRRKKADEYALVIPEDLLDKIEVLDPTAYKGAIQGEAPPGDQSSVCETPDCAQSSVCQTPEPPIKCLSDTPPTRKNYLPDKDTYPKITVVALGAELTTACTHEEKIMKPEEVDKLAGGGLRGPALARRAVEESRGKRPPYRGATTQQASVEPPRFRAAMDAMDAALARMGYPGEGTDAE